MGIGGIIAIIVVVVLVVLVAVIAGAYNSLVSLNERVNEAWSDITVQLKYRADLIPNVVETVKGYAKHEKETFAMVTEARSAVMGAKTVKAAAEVQRIYPAPVVLTAEADEASDRSWRNQNYENPHS